MGDFPEVLKIFGDNRVEILVFSRPTGYGTLTSFDFSLFK